MSDKTTKENETNGAALDWTDATDIKFSISYLFICDGGASVAWQMKILLNEFEKDLRQKHFAQDAANQAETRHAYNVEMISHLVTAAPVGLPGFDQYLKDAPGETDGERLQKAVYAYLIRDKPALIKLADETLNFYTNANMPAEYLPAFK